MDSIINHHWIKTEYRGICIDIQRLSSDQLPKPLSKLAVSTGRTERLETTSDVEISDTSDIGLVS